jgi:hypothetical protein
MDVAKMISKSLSEKLVIAKVDGVLWDLERPLEKSASLELLDFEHPEGEHRSVFTIACISSPSRQTGILAFKCTCSWRGSGKALWMPSMFRSTYRRWLLLRHVYT